MPHPAALRYIVATALKFRVLVLAAAAAVMVAGVVSAPAMKLDALPEFAPPQVEIQTEALGLSAGEVEQLITVPLEADLLNGVAWLDEIRSESIAGLSSIELVFEPGTDVLEARQVVAERLTQAHALPNVSKPPAMLQPRSATSRVMMVGLSSQNLSLMDMSVLARWQIRPFLMGVPGVANVAIWGQREQQLQVRVDPKRLRDNGVSLVQVVESTGNALWVSPLSFVEASTPGTGGFIDTPSQRLGVQHISPITTAKALAAVTVEDTEGQVLRLGQVADVVEDHQPLIGDGVVENASGLMLVIEKFPGVSTPEVTEGIENALADLGPGLPGIKIDTSVYQSASFIDSALDNLALVGLIALLLLVLLVGTYLLEWRAAFISLVAVLLSLSSAVLVLFLLNATVNLMVLAGLVLALGVIVDDALVDVTSMRRRLAERPDSGDDASSAAAVLKASLEMRGALVAATVIALVAAAPVLLLPGLTGEFAQPLIWSYALAVVTSTVVALAVTPVLGLLLLRPAPRSNRRLVSSLRRRYHDGLSRFAGDWRRVFGAVALVAAAGIAVLPQLDDRDLLPTLREPVLLIEWDGAPGMSQPEMTRLAARASDELGSLPGVVDVGGHVGRAITSDQVVGVDSGELWVSIDPDADYDATAASVTDIVHGYPGISGVVGTYTDERLQDVDTASDDQLVVRVYGQDLEVLQAKAAELTGVLAEVDGVVAPRVDAELMTPTVEVEVDLASAEQHRIKPGDVRRAAATLLSGVEVGSLFEEQKVFEVVVWGTPQIRHSMTSVEELMIDVPGGGTVELGDVADVRMTPNSSVISREAVSRRVDVIADLDGRDLGDVTGDVEDAIAAVEFPLEYHAEVLDGSVGGYTGDRDIWGISIAAVVLIFLLLQAVLRSWRLAGLVVVTLPVSLVGGVLVAVLSDGAVTMVALAALLTILALAVRTVLVLAQESRRASSEMGRNARDAVLEAAADRVGPVLATAAAIGLLMLPIAVFGGAAGLEVLRPAALVILGGLVTSTLYALFVVPVLFVHVDPHVASNDADSSDPSPDRPSHVTVTANS